MYTLVMKKIIFLDIDGVLVTFSHIAEHEAGRLLTEFDPNCLRRFEEFLKKHGDIFIVISSTWRKFKLERIYEQSPLIQERTIDMTGKIENSRTQEIVDYLSTAGYTDYAVLDDAWIDPTMIEEERIITTDMMYGIQDSHIMELENLFYGRMV